MYCLKVEKIILDMRGKNCPEILVAIGMDRKIYGASVPIETKEWQCRTGRGRDREFLGIRGRNWAPNTFKAGRGRKTASAMALVAQSRWALL